MAKKLLFIVNLHAGKLKSRSSLFDAVSVFSSAGYLVSVACTSCHGDATEIAEKQGARFDKIVCCGGDGTLSETVAGIMRLQKQPDIGYIPAGTTNDFASFMSIPKDPVVAAKIAVGGVRQSLDVGCFNDKSFVYVASFGAFTATSYSASQSFKNALGPAAYILEGIKDLPSVVKPYSLKIDADGENIDGDYLFGAVSNSTSIGGIVKYKKNEVLVDDGKYELILLENPHNPLEIQGLASALLSQHYDHKGIIRRQISSITFKTEENLNWALDGEFANGGNEIKITNCRRAVNMMI